MINVYSIVTVIAQACCLWHAVFSILALACCFYTLSILRSHLVPQQIQAETRSFHNDDDEQYYSSITAASEQYHILLFNSTSRCYYDYDE
jgi:hypothetical protein